MSAVVNQPSGTAWISRIEDIEMCGKTGTVQNPHGKDHSVFVAFAPRYNPKIAIAVVVENAGFGSTWSAPIASLMVEKYINKTIKRPQAYIDRLMQANLLPGAAERSIGVKATGTDSTKKVLNKNLAEGTTTKNNE